jgi:hypothetical protein
VGWAARRSSRLGGVWGYLRAPPQIASYQITLHFYHATVLMAYKYTTFADVSCQLSRPRWIRPHQRCQMTSHAPCSLLPPLFPVTYAWDPRVSLSSTFGHYSILYLKSPMPARQTTGAGNGRPPPMWVSSRVLNRTPPWEPPDA